MQLRFIMCIFKFDCRTKHPNPTQLNPSQTNQSNPTQPNLTQPILVQHSKFLSKLVKCYKNKTKKKIKSRICFIKCTGFITTTIVCSLMLCPNKQ